MVISTQIQGLSNGPSNYSIIRVILNTESDTDCLKSCHGHMAHSKMATLVCPVSMCLGQGLYAELFLIGALLQAAEIAKKTRKSKVF